MTRFADFGCVAEEAGDVGSGTMNADVVAVDGKIYYVVLLKSVFHK